MLSGSSAWRGCCTVLMTDDMRGMANTRLDAAVSKLAARGQKGRVVDVQRTYLPMKEATKYMGCTRYMLMSLREQGKVRCSKIGKMLYFAKEDMDRLFEDNIVNAAAYSASRTGC